MTMRIEYVNHGVANRFSDRIEINKHLKNYPQLLRPILRHEMQHTNKTFSGKDLRLDLAHNKIKNVDMLNFMIRHPKSLTHFLPLYWTRRSGFVLDFNLFFIWGMTFGIGWFVLFMLGMFT